MLEFKFVLKCFIFASLLMMFSQVRKDGLTFESRVEVFLTESSTARFIQSAAQGGAKALVEFYSTARSYIDSKVGSSSSRSTTMNLDEEDRF